MGFRDLRAFLTELEAKGLLRRVQRPIDKDTELMPLVRWQFRGQPESQRKAWLFENVVDQRGRRYGPVAVGVVGGSQAIYAAAFEVPVEQVQERWMHAQLNPIPPVLLATGPVKEEIHRGPELAENGHGLEAFPHPISTPGFDAAPFMTSPYVVTKDPETGSVNVGTYRAMLKGPTKCGLNFTRRQHIGVHYYEKAQKLGKPLEAAIVIGAAPAVGMASASKLPYGKSEYDVAGGLLGEPLELVKCETVDLEVPAHAEIVLEGVIPLDHAELEGPFGEYPGYMHRPHWMPVFHLTCVTHRKDAIYQAFLSQMPPSESSMLRKIAYRAVMFKFLRHDCNIHSVTDVALHEASGSTKLMVIQMKNPNPAQPWQALRAASGFDSALGKMFVTVDDDIDPADLDSVVWALSYRMQPARDLQVITHRNAALDPSATPPGHEDEEANEFPPPHGGSGLLMDATRKWAYTPVSLPARQYMEHAREIWQELNLPPLEPRVPWFGYNLGAWSQEDAVAADLAARGEYRVTAEQRAAPSQGQPTVDGADGSPAHPAKTCVP
jgi:4-hydroxy-3-polyprenylbenzoate decarboxylase